MKYENLIWVIIFLVCVVVIILKKVRAASTAGEKGIAKKRPEWKEKLDTFLSRVKQELNATEPIGKGISPTRTEQVSEEMLSPKTMTSSVKAAAKRMEPAVSPKTRLPEGMAYGISDLRKAVIWSEILAPPLALRDKN